MTPDREDHVTNTVEAAAAYEKHRAWLPSGVTDRDGNDIEPADWSDQ